MLVAGGQGAPSDEEGSPVFSSAEVFDPADRAWHELPPMRFPRAGATAVVLADGRVLVVGGWNDRTAEVFDPRSDTWTRVGDLVADGKAAVLLADGRVLDIDDPATGTLSAELFDPATGTWRATAPPRARSEHTATERESGELLLVGAVRGLGSYLTHPILVAPPANRWTVLDVIPSSIPAERRWHTATSLFDGRVLVVGGHGAHDVLGSTALFDPATLRWTATGDLAVPRYLHAAIRLTDGSVLVVGGFARSADRDATTLLECYDPSTGVWRDVGRLQGRRTGLTLSLLPDGSVLALGGTRRQGGASRSADRYDPATNNWQAAAQLPLGRFNHTATLLRDGQVLVAGGCCTVSDALPVDDAHLYDPRTDMWRETGRLEIARSGHSAHLLLDHHDCHSPLGLV